MFMKPAFKKNTKPSYLPCVSASLNFLPKLSFLDGITFQSIELIQRDMQQVISVLFLPLKKKNHPFEIKDIVRNAVSKVEHQLL